MRADPAASGHRRGGPFPPPSILLVERDEGLRLALAESLSVAGYRALTADGPFAALRVVASPQATGAVEPLAAPSHVHLVICDLVMPGMNALELYEALHLEANGGKMLLITAYPMPQTGAALARRAGVRWAAKPIGLQTLQGLVSQMLRERADA